MAQPARPGPTRRFILMAGAAAPLGLAVACGDDNSSGGGKGGTLHMGIAVANIGLNFAVEMVNGAKSAVGHLGGVDLKAVGPASTDGPAEVTLFQNLTHTSKDGIILFNLDPPLFVRPAATAVDSGIPVVALDTAPLDGSKITFYVGNDNYELGAKLAEEAIKRLPASPTGSVVVGVPNPGTPVLDSRANGIKDTFAEKAPGVKVLGPYQTYSDPAQNFGAWQSQVHANPKALAFLGVGDADSYSLARLKKQTGGKYLTAGFDLDNQTLQAVKDGVNFVTISPEHFLKGYVALALLANAVKDGSDVPKGWIDVPGLVVDESNIDTIIARQASQEGRKTQIAPAAQKIVDDLATYTKPYGDAR